MTILLMMLMSFTSCAYAQTISDGIQKEYYPNGALHYERSYKNGMKDGISREFYENGVLKTEAIRVDGKLQGTLKTYYPSGALDQTYEYKDDAIEGMVSKYFENGKLDHASEYKNDMPTGKIMDQFQYYENGDLKMEYHLDSYKPELVRKEYYRNKRVSSIMTVKDGKTAKQEFDEQGNLVSN